MTKKAGKKKRIIIILAMVLLALSVPFVLIYHNYTKEICVMEPVEHMEQREGVSMDNILVEIEYSIITDGEFRNNQLYIFENGDVYSSYSINYHYVYNYYSQEEMERSVYHTNMDDRYWDYLCEQCYWGRLSPRDMDSIINEFAQIDDYFDCYLLEDYIVPDPTPDAVTQEERTYDEENNNIYMGHVYEGGRIERKDGTEFLLPISRGTDEEIYTYRYDEHFHNVIDIVKSTWAYKQWTNQIFGEGWEERIDLNDELKGVERERKTVRSWTQYWDFFWDSILSLFF